MIRPIVVGGLLGAVLSAAQLYAGAKTGIVDGGNIPAALVGFAILRALRRPSVDDGNLVQTVASAAAYMALAGGFLGPIAALVMSGSELSLVGVIAWSIAVGVVGTLLAIPLRGAFRSLAFPSQTAVAGVIRTVYDTQQTRGHLRVLAISALIAACFAALRDFGQLVPADFTGIPLAAGLVAEDLAIGVAWSPLLLAVGSLVGLRMALTMALGVAIAWFGLAPLLVEHRLVEGTDYPSVVTWLLWPGAGLMLGGTIAGIAQSWDSLRAGVRALGDVRTKSRATIAAVTVGALGIVVLGAIVFDVHPAISAFAIAASVVLCAAAGRATGETDNTPAGALGGVGQIAIGIAAPGGIAAPLVGGGVIQGTAMMSSVMLGNWKTGALLGTSPRAQLIAQLVGVAIGAVVTTLTFALLTSSYAIGSEQLPIGTAQTWKATAEVVQHGVSSLPEFAPPAAFAGLVFGIVLASSRRTWMPSPVALGMAFIIPPIVSITIAIGAVAWWIATRRSRAWAASYGETLASGAIAGEAIVGLVVAGLVVAGLREIAQ